MTLRSMSENNPHILVDADADPDAADDWIAERANAKSIIITADILLAERGVNVDATVLAPTGKPFTKDSIGSAPKAVIDTRPKETDRSCPV